MSVAQRSEGGGRGMTCSPDDLPVTCSPDDHVMTPWSPPGDYLLFPLFGNLLFWMSPPPPPVLVFYCLWTCIPTSLLVSVLPPQLLSYHSILIVVTCAKALNKRSNISVTENNMLYQAKI